LWYSIYEEEGIIMNLTIREPGSAITHFIACVMAAAAAVPLIIKGQSGMTTAALSIFAASMILLYGSSALYHSVNVSGKVLQYFRKIDHMMIFVLIAGSYTPVCLIILGEGAGYRLLAIVWSVAIVGMLIKAFWITCPKWFSSIIYIAMGWLCLMVFGTLWNTLSRPAFGWLLAGGIIYTAGGIIYALKLPVFNSIHKNFGSHEIFHLFVMAGSICHFIFMYCYVA
jgi:hemolysin III